MADPGSAEWLEEALADIVARNRRIEEEIARLVGPTPPKFTTTEEADEWMENNG